MYNGIGLSTARGSATSGHITKNLSHVKPSFYRDKLTQNRNSSSSIEISAEVNRKGNSDILDHKRKRDIESKVFELEDQLREEGCGDIEIERKTESLRNRLSRNPRNDIIVKKGSNIDSHEMSRRKDIENRNMREAFGIRGNNDDTRGNSKADGDTHRESRKTSRSEFEEK